MGFCKNPLCHTVADRVPLWEAGVARSAGVSVLSGHVIDCFLYRHTVADVFVCVIPGPDPGIQVDRLARTRALCVACGLRPCRILRFAWIHSCTGRNRGHTVRANAATPEQSYFLLLWIKIGRLRNTEITGAGWSPLSPRDIIICTITWIPGSGPGMTKAVVFGTICTITWIPGSSPGMTIK